MQNCLQVTFIDSGFRTDKNYYPRVFLEECKHVFKEQKIPKYIIEDIEISANESDKEDSSEYDSDQENSNQEN